MRWFNHDYAVLCILSRFAVGERRLRSLEKKGGRTFQLRPALQKRTVSRLLVQSSRIVDNHIRVGRLGRTHGRREDFIGVDLLVYDLAYDIGFQIR
jgi:hypothetical protein